MVPMGKWRADRRCMEMIPREASMRDTLLNSPKQSASEDAACTAGNVDGTCWERSLDVFCDSLNMVR